MLSKGVLWCDVSNCRGQNNFWNEWRRSISSGAVHNTFEQFPHRIAMLSGNPDRVVTGSNFQWSL
jgi:hypothetical protein